MHPYISQRIAAERTRDMRARATRTRWARQVRGSASKATRRTLHVTRPWAHPATEPAPQLTPVPAGPDRVSAQPGQTPAGTHEHAGRAA